MARVLSKPSLPFTPGRRKAHRKEAATVTATVARARRAHDAARRKAAESLSAKRAEHIGQSIREMGEQVEQAQAIDADTIDYFIDLYLQRVPINIPPDKRYVDFDARSGRAPDIIHRIMGLLGTQPQPVFIAASPNPRAVEKAQAIQRHLVGADDWFRQQYGPVDDQAFFWQILVGRSYIQQTWLPAYWDKNELRRKRKPGKEDSTDLDDYDEGPEAYADRRITYKSVMGPPMMREALDPRIVWEIPSPGGTKEWIKHYAVQRFELINEFRRFDVDIAFDEKTGKISSVNDISGRAGLELPPAEGDANTPIVDYYEYIDSEWVYYVVDDRVVYAFEHKGGITIEKAHGIVTGFKEWELQSVSVLFPVRNLLPQLDFLLTLWFNKAYIDVFPQLFEELGEGLEPTTKDSEPMQIEPMSIRPTRGKILNPMAERESSMDFKAVYDTVERDIDLSTISGEVRGMSASGQSGHAISQALEASKASWRNIPETRAIQWSNLYAHYLFCVKHLIGEEVAAFSIDRGAAGHLVGGYYAIEPDDIPDFYHVLADCEPVLPINAQGEMLAWAKVGAEGQATDEEVSRHGFRRNDWEDRRRQIDRDNFRRQAFPMAVEDAIKLGKLRVQGREAEILGLDQVNPLFQQSLQAQEQPTMPPGGALNPAAPQNQQMSGGDMGANGVGLGPDNGVQPAYGASVNETGPRQVA